MIDSARVAFASLLGTFPFFLFIFRRVVSVLEVTMLATLSSSCHGPVTTLDCAPNDESIFFAISNRVLCVQRVSDSSACTSWPTVAGHRVVCELPSGATVIAVAHSSHFVLAASADCIYAAGVAASTEESKVDLCSKREQSVRVLCTDGARILRVHYAGEKVGFVVATALNSVYVIPLHHLASQFTAASSGTHAPVVPPALFCVAEGPRLGVILAMDTLVTVEGDSQSSPSADTGSHMVAVYAASYSGSVVEWGSSFGASTGTATHSSTTTKKGCILAHIAAHHAGCAVFAVKAWSRRGTTRYSLAELVATCSDDRSATLFRRVGAHQNGAQGAPTFPRGESIPPNQWECVWRGAGTGFSRSRVFDIAVYGEAIADHSVRVWCGVGSEDGGVQVVHFPTISMVASGSRPEEGRTTMAAAETLLYRPNQHDGHGVYKVGFSALCAKESGEEQDAAPGVVSCGFDGTVALTRFYTPSLNSHGGGEVARLCVVPEAGRTAASRHRPRVRGVHVDLSGRALVTTETELLVWSGLESEAPARLHWAAALSSEHEPLSAALDRKGRLPTALASLCSDASQFYALVGTESGAVVLQPYTAATENTADQLIGIRSDAWLPFRKVISATVFRNATNSNSCGAVVVAVVVSCHGDQSVLLTVVKTSPHSTPQLFVLAKCGGCSGPLSTAVHVRWAMRESDDRETAAWVLVGEKTGQLRGFDFRGIAVASPESVHASNANLHQPVVLPPLIDVSLFGPGVPIAALYSEEEAETMAAPQGDRKAVADDSLPQPLLPVTIVAADGAFVQTSLGALRCGRAGTRVVCPLRFPSGVSGVLAASPAMWITQYGTAVSVYTRRPGVHTWRCAASYTGVRAPRLLAARVYPCEGSESRTDCVIAHCSDGEHVERLHHGYAGGGGGKNLLRHMTCAPDSTTVLFGGVIPGKDFCCAQYLPSPVHGVVCGNEDSTLTVLHLPCGGVKEGPALNDALPLTFAGPHSSNVLAMTLLHCADAVCRFVSVGGLATVVVWECSAAWRWRVVAHSSATEDDLCPNADKQGSEKTIARAKAAHLKKHDKGERRTVVVPGSPRGVSTESVPRHLSVCALNSHTFVVGSSDAHLYLYRLRSSGEEETLSCERRRLLRESCPRPVFAVNRDAPSTLEGEREPAPMTMMIAGDTTGNVYLVAGTELAVVACGKMEESAVNALSVMHRVKDAACVESGSQSWRALSVHDSGTVRLLALSAQKRGAHYCSGSVVCLMQYGGGVTAGRAVSWPALRSPAVVVGEERMTELSLDVVSLAQLHVRDERRVNVRCVSGVATRTSDSGAITGIAVVGQGVELLWGE